MILVSITNNKFIYKNNNDNKIIKLSRSSETINKLIQYELNNNNNSVFNIIDIEFIFLLLDLNEKELLNKIKINECDFHVLRMYKYNNVSLYTIFEELYSSTSKTCGFNSSSIITYKCYYLIGSNKSQFFLHRENDLPAFIFSNGTKEWYKHGRRNRENDLPAVILSNGTKEWYKNNLLHRENDLPAIIFANGTKVWYKNGSLHRENDLPARISGIGSKYWYKNDSLHRENDLPAIIYPDGSKSWYKNGSLHRENDLPAVINSNCVKYWFKDGLRYRENDLPAFINSDGQKTWYKNGVPHREK